MGRNLEASLNSVLAASQLEKWWLFAWYNNDSTGISLIPLMNSSIDLARPTSFLLEVLKIKSPKPKFSVIKTRKSVRSVLDLLCRNAALTCLAISRLSISVDWSIIGMDGSIFRTHCANFNPASGSLIPFFGNRTSEITPIILFLYFLIKLCAVSKLVVNRILGLPLRWSNRWDWLKLRFTKFFVWYIISL